jgi:hypothetical protein
VINEDPQYGKDPVGILEQPGSDETATATLEQPVSLGAPPEFATRARKRAQQRFRQNPFIVIGAGAIVVALLIFVVSMPRESGPKTAKPGAVGSSHDPAEQVTAVPSDKSLFPIMESGKAPTQEAHHGFLNERDLERTAKAKPSPNVPPALNTPGTIGSIPPFGEQQNWHAPPYQSGPNTTNSGDTPDPSRMDREAMEKSSLVYVRNVSQQASPRADNNPSLAPADLGLDLPIGTRLRARLETAATSAVRAPVLAVIEYNYDHDGEIVVPAGTKAVGHLQDSDRSGYVRVQFDSLLTPEGATWPIQAVATDLQMRPLRGKVEGKNTGKNILVRSLSGIGQAGAMLAGRGSLNQPLSESDLLRERVSNNIGEASDEQISKMAITQHVVVTIPADTPIYVVLEQGPRTDAIPPRLAPRERQTGTASDTQELRQLLQLQRELNHPNAPSN